MEIYKCGNIPDVIVKDCNIYKFGYVGCAQNCFNISKNQGIM